MPLLTAATIIGAILADGVQSRPPQKRGQCRGWTHRAYQAEIVRLLARRPGLTRNQICEEMLLLHGPGGPHSRDFSMECVKTVLDYTLTDGLIEDVRGPRSRVVYQLSVDP